MLDCFPQPGACGYPDPNYSSDAASACASWGWGAGPYCDSQLQAQIGCTLNASVACSSLPHASTGGAISGTVSDTNYTGAISIDSGATLHDDCVTVTGSNLARNRASAIRLTTGTTLTVTDSTISSTSNTQMAEYGIQDGYSGTVILQHDHLHDFGEVLAGSNWNVSDSYIFTTKGAFTDNGPGGTPTQPCDSPCPESTQDVYFDPASSTSLSFVHDTLLNPHGEQVASGEGAVIYGDNVAGGSCGDWTLTVKDNLVAGGSSGITTCGGGSKTSTQGTATVDIEDNDYARCDTPTIGSSPSGDTSAVSCQGATVPATGSNCGGLVYPGADSHGYAPNGGSHIVNDILYCNGAVCAGRLTISWYQVPRGAHLSRTPTPILVATLSRTISRSSRLRLKIALTRAGRRLLKSVRHVKLTAKASFAPQGQHATDVVKNITLRR